MRTTSLALSEERERSRQRESLLLQEVRAERRRRIDLEAQATSVERWKREAIEAERATNRASSEVAEFREVSMAATRSEQRACRLAEQLRESEDSVMVLRQQLQQQQLQMIDDANQSRDRIAELEAQLSGAGLTGDASSVLAGSGVRQQGAGLSTARQALKELKDVRERYTSLLSDMPS